MQTVINMKSIQTTKLHSPIGWQPLTTLLSGGITLLLMTGEAVAGLPEIPEVPPTVAASHADIVQQRETLLQERAALKTRAAMNKVECQAVKEKSAEEARCIESSSALSTDVDHHVQATQQFVTILDPMVVDARNVPSGLPKSVDDNIPHTPAGNRVRKGFQAIMAHDWNVAHAWFQDALYHEPNDEGIKRLVDLAEYAMKGGKKPRPAKVIHVPTPDEAEQIRLTKAVLDKIGDAMENQIIAGLQEYIRSGLREPETGSHVQLPEDSDLELLMLPNRAPANSTPAKSPHN